MKVRRHIRRDDWTSFHDVTYARMRAEFRGVEAEMQRMHIGRADAPFSVPCGDGRLVIADSGYSWLQIAPRGAHWWMTAMYDPAGRPVQYYFDVTNGNVLAGGKDCWFDDLYLDVVLHADGALETLDRDELDAALAAGKITEAQHRTALAAERELRGWLNRDAMAELDGIYAALAERALVPWEALPETAAME
ncbi:MAG: DUF402 domain-containing protein [Clostridia bacterium]|nr:DUF402 domain-containing protein [Clostridia bacterium]